MNVINYSCIPFEMYCMNLYVFYHYYFSHCYLIYVKFGPLVLRILNSYIWVYSQLGNYDLYLKDYKRQFWIFVYLTLV